MMEGAVVLFGVVAAVVALAVLAYASERVGYLRALRDAHALACDHRADSRLTAAIYELSK
jgi:hypothetical protein